MAFSVDVDGILHSVSHGSVLVAAITSCSNTSNPSVLLGAGLMAKKAIEAGLSVAKLVRTSLAPGSGVVTTYLQVRASVGSREFPGNCRKFPV